jgi:hypothetical protein
MNRCCYFTLEEQPDRENWYNNMFFCSYSMRENYLTYRDFIFVNKRLSKTRFNRCLLMFCGITSNGRSVLLGFALLAKEDEQSYFFAVNQFHKAVAGDEPPKLIVLERSNMLRA